AAPDGARIFKGDLDVPNEDAVLALDDGPLTLLAVADGHHGAAASQHLIATLAQRPIPPDPLALIALLRALQGEPDLEAEDQTTLLIAVVARARSAGFALSFGDSSLLVLAAAQPPVQVNRKGRTYVSPWHPGSLDPRRAQEVAFSVTPGDLVVAF